MIEHPAVAVLHRTVVDENSGFTVSNSLIFKVLRDCEDHITGWIFSPHQPVKPARSTGSNNGQGSCVVLVFGVDRDMTASVGDGQYRFIYQSDTVLYGPAHQKFIEFPTICEYPERLLRLNLSALFSETDPDVTALVIDQIRRKGETEISLGSNGYDATAGFVPRHWSLFDQEYPDTIIGEVVGRF